MDNSDMGTYGTTCDLVFSTLHLLLLRTHSFVKSRRLGRAGVVRASLLEPEQSPPLILQPVIDMLQYEAFCDRVTHEIDKVVQGLYRSGVPTKVHFRGIGDSGSQLVSLLQKDEQIKVGGECLVRIEQRYKLYQTCCSLQILIQLVGIGIPCVSHSAHPQRLWHTSHKQLYQSRRFSNYLNS